MSDQMVSISPNKDYIKTKINPGHTKKNKRPTKKFSEKILNACIDNCKHEIFFNYTYEELLLDMYIINESKQYKHKQVSIETLSYKYKIVFILYSLLYDQSIYIHSLHENNTNNNIIQLTDIDVINIKDSWLENNNDPDNSKHIYSNLIHTNTNKINYYNNNNNKLYQADWDDIEIFANNFIQNSTNNLIQTSFNIENLDEIYFIYFIPIAVLLNKKIIFNTRKNYNKDDNMFTLTIGDYKSKTDKDIVIVNKYTNTINITYKTCIFFNYTINQFITYSIKLNNNSMLGKLYSYITIKDSILYYKDLELQLPQSYILKQNILYIKKKTQKSSVHTHLTNFEKLIIKHKKKRLLCLAIQSDVIKILTNENCKRLFEYILFKYPTCNCNCKYNNKNNKNIYLYNTPDENKEFINNSLFSMNFYIKKSLIVISYSELVHTQINNIIIELNTILNTSSIDKFISENGLCEKILNNLDDFRKIYKYTYQSHMNTKSFLKEFGFCTIKSFDIYYYKCPNRFCNLDKIDRIIDVSKHIKTNINTLEFGYQFLIELELDIGVHIIIKYNNMIEFYIKRDLLDSNMYKHVHLQKLNSYNHIDNIDTSISIINLFTKIYEENSDFMYFSNKNDCSTLSLCMAKHILKQNPNEYIKLQNKLCNNINITHKLECIATFIKNNNNQFMYVPKILQNIIIKNFSTKYFYTSTINSSILLTLHTLSKNKKKY